jgi:hypothetical protein
MADGDGLHIGPMSGEGAVDALSRLIVARLGW